MKRDRQFVIIAHDGNGGSVRAGFSERELRILMGDALINGVMASQRIEGEEPLEPTDEEREAVYTSIPEAMLHTDI